MNQHTGYDWCFTVNAHKINDEPADFEHAIAELEPIYDALEDLDYQYVCARGEQGALNGTCHIQGFVQFDDIWKHKEVVKHFNDRTGCNFAKIAKRRGTPKQARDYVFKVGEYEEEIDTTWYDELGNEVLPLRELGEYHEEDRHERKQVRGRVVRAPKEQRKMTRAEILGEAQRIDDLMFQEFVIEELLGC